MIKFRLHIFSFSILLIASSSYAGGIKGTVKNLTSPKVVYMYQYFGEVITKYDSTTVSKSGNFSFNTSFPRGLYRIGFSLDSSAGIVLGEENLDIHTQLPGFVSNFSVKNSVENNLFKAYSNISNSFAIEVEKLQKKYDQNAQLAEDNPDQYNKLVTSLRSKYDSLNKVRNKKLEDLAKKNPTSFVAKIATAYISPDSLKPTNYFRKEDFSDVELTRGDMLSNKIKTYFQMFVQPQEQALASGVNDLLLKFPYGSPNREVFFISILSLFNQFQTPLNKQIKTQYKSEYPKSEHAKVFLPTLRQDAPDIGDEAPNIVMSDTSGKSTSLASLKGKVVLLDFWASWCGPCRMENPNVVRAYNKYKSKGFTVFSVSLDNSREKWLAAIKKDNLTWTHVSELKGWETSASRLYQVTGIPATFLIDKEGKIIARNLRGPALDEMLEKLLGN